MFDEIKRKQKITPSFHWKGQIKDIFTFLSSDIYLFFFFWEFLISKLLDEIRGNKGKKQCDPILLLERSSQRHIYISFQWYRYLLFFWEFLISKLFDEIKRKQRKKAMWPHLTIGKVKSKTFYNSFQFYRYIYIYFENS